MGYRNWIEIDSSALKKNIKGITNILRPGVKFCAVVKANAYGHGLTEVLNISLAEGVSAFAVDNLTDALYIRRISANVLIIILGYILHENIEQAIKNSIHITVYDIDTLKFIEEKAALIAKQAYVHLKIETGTSRQGINSDDLKKILDFIDNSLHISIAGLSTHYANMEDTSDSSYGHAQYMRFNEAVKTVNEAGYNPKLIHSACSAAIILYPDTQGTLVRAGISLYGLWPSDGVEKSVFHHSIPLRLSPVLSWKTRIAQIKSLKRGTPIGYGMTEVLDKDSVIAVLPVGYWDGLDRKMSSVGEVLISGSRCRIIGRVCMNMCIVDISSLPKACIEQEVTILGKMANNEITAEEIAGKIDTINYEIVSRINQNTKRVIV
jgi:alanine racemase